MINDDVSIEKSVNNFRSLVLFANKRTGSVTTIKWFHDTHKKYIDYPKMQEAVKDLGYEINEESETYNLFTKDGMFYDVITQFEIDNDIEKLKIAIETIFSYRPTHRIILEELPIEAVELIAVTVNTYHTSILFLTRKNRLKRLLSLWLAEKTNVYYIKDSLIFDYNNFKIPKLDIEYLIKKENFVNDINIEAWNMLKLYGPRFIHLYYEDIFKENYELGESDAILHIAFNWLFYRTNDFTGLIKNGYFNLNKYYNSMIGIKKLETELQVIKRSNFSNIHVDM